MSFEPDANPLRIGDEQDRELGERAAVAADRNVHNGVAYWGVDAAGLRNQAIGQFVADRHAQVSVAIVGIQMRAIVRAESPSSEQIAVAGGDHRGVAGAAVVFELFEVRQQPVDVDFGCEPGLEFIVQV